MTKRHGAAARPPRPARPRPEALQWLDGISPGDARLTCVGCGTLLAENFLCALEFTPDRIRLRTASGVLCVEGEGLSLENVRPHQATIRGAIFRISLPGKGGDENGAGH